MEIYLKTSPKKVTSNPCFCLSQKSISIPPSQAKDELFRVSWNLILIYTNSHERVRLNEWWWACKVKNFMRACVLQWRQRQLRRCALKANRLSRSDLIEQSWFMTREDIHTKNKMMMTRRKNFCSDNEKKCFLKTNFNI